jgi:phosphoglucosamine mutase
LRRYFGTDGVRGVVGESLTPELVERLGRAATIWAGGGEVLVGRDTRGSGPELEKALARGIVSAGGTAVLGGILPTPAVALFARDLGAVISASHNPPEYNGVKFFAAKGSKLSDSSEEEIEALLDSPPSNGGSIARTDQIESDYVAHLADHFDPGDVDLKVVVDCANGALCDTGPEVFWHRGANVVPIGNEPDGTNINVGCGATDLRLLQRTVVDEKCDLGIAFDGDGDRMLAVDHEGNVVDGDQILAILALHLKVDVVAVTQMTNLGFHELMAERGIRVVTTDVGDRYVLEALEREGGKLGGEQSGHILYLDAHVTGDGLAAALLLCGALEGRTLAEAASVMRRFPQVMENVPVSRKDISTGVQEEVKRLNQADSRTRVLVRPSGTEPVIRVLAEAETEREATRLCGTIASLVRRELG